MSETKMPVLGQNKEYTEEEIKSIQEKEVERKLKIMDDLDKIAAPILCTVILPEGSFEYRNLNFWEAFKEKDQAVRTALTDYLNTKGKK